VEVDGLEEMADGVRMLSCGGQEEPDSANGAFLVAALSRQACEPEEAVGS